ncbi:hypothetical protein KB221_07500 [Aquidulcibacter paucihalophilus]|nr:hypothetical protein KB221_07500 [Aquidulcibacter paucihalophilus]
MSETDYPILIIFSREPDDEMVELLRLALRAEGAEPEEGTGAGRLNGRQAEKWHSSRGEYLLTHHDGLVLLEATAPLIEAIRMHVQPRDFDANE